MTKTLGVIGGMGPQATADFFQKVLDNTKADRDQDHIHVIIDSNPKTPDRTEAILGSGESPLKALVNSALKLQLMGADFLAMPCNTAHYFYDDIVKFIDIPFINMIDEVSATVRVRDPKATRVGLLATKGVYSMGLYSRYLQKYDLEAVIPPEEGKEIVGETIYTIKKDINLVDPTGINRVINEMKSKGVDTIILGCTELPLIVDRYPERLEYIDSTLVLAKKAVELTRREVIY
ncbi:MAG: amino acid racemase [Desulfitobacteriaceae bacterium]|nr:amino acid racemase [Desulfitobacteriaceae bacterium]